MNFEPRYSEENINVTPRNHLGDFFRLSAWLLAVVVTAYLCLGFAAEKIAECLPPKYEAAMAGSFTSKLDYEAFPHTRDYLQKVLVPLVASSKDNDLPEFPYRISVHQNDAVNAVALPAGQIIVYSGLLAEIRSENELAMVLAHELGHYAHRDHLRGLGRGLVFLSIMTVLGLGGDAPGFLSPSIRTLSLKYSRDQEAAADLFAIDLIARTYGHAGGAIEVFKVLKRQKRNMNNPGFFSTHPDTIWRMQALDSYLKLNKLTPGTVRSLPEPGRLPFPDDRKGT